MIRYFKPWNRMVGSILLVLACVTVAAWVRSLQSQDFIVRNHLISRDGTIQYIEWYDFHLVDMKPEGGEVTVVPDWDKPPKTDLPKKELASLLATFPAKILWQVPYWSITMELTFFGCLLIIKPWAKPTTST